MKFLLAIILPLIFIGCQDAYAVVGVDTDYVNFAPLALPSICNQGDLRFDSSSAKMQICNPANTWSAVSTGGSFTNPMTAKGDIIYNNASLVPAALAVGSNGNVLTLAGGVPTWAPSSGGVSSLNSLTGGLSITAGTGISVTPSGSSIAIANTATPVSSLNTLTGAVTLAAGTGITLTPSGNTITVASTASGLSSIAAYSTLSNNTSSSAVPTAVQQLILGTPGYTDTGFAMQATGSTNSYFQSVIQNTSTGTASSADYIVSNNSGTASTFYGDFGINGSNFSGTGSLSLPSATYLYSQSGDLAIGTNTLNAMHFVVNASATDTMTLTTAGQVQYPNLTANTLLNLDSSKNLNSLPAGTAGQILTSNGSSSPPSWVTQSSGISPAANGMVVALWPYSNVNYWSTTNSSGTPVDLTVNGTIPTPTYLYSKGFATIGNTAGTLPGLTFVAPVSGTLEIEQAYHVNIGTASAGVSLYETTTAKDLGRGMFYNLSSLGMWYTVSGFLDVVGGTTYTVVLRATVSGSTLSIGDIGGTASAASPQLAMKMKYVNAAGLGGGTSPQPTIQKFLSGTGTYALPTNPTPSYIKVTMVGGGGGGGSNSSGAGTNGGTGGNTTFGTSLLTAGGGAGGTGGDNNYSGLGGTNTITAGPIVLVNLQGGAGQGSTALAAGSYGAGGMGGASPFGGAGGGSTWNTQQTTQNAVVNSGSGAAGNGGISGGWNGGGGGAGGYIQAMIMNPSGTYAYGIGAAGTAGDGTNGVGGSGQIIVEEYYAGSTSIARSINSISTPTTAQATNGYDYIYYVSGTTTLTLPTAVQNSNLYTVKNTGSNTVTVNTTSSQTIDGSLSITLIPNQSVNLLSDIANWRVQ